MFHPRKYLLLGCAAFTSVADDDAIRRGKLVGRWEEVRTRTDYVELNMNGTCRFRLDGREELKAQWEYYEGTLRLVYIGIDSKSPELIVLDVRAVTNSYLLLADGGGEGKKRSFQLKT